MKVTLGPKGRNVLLEKSFGAPRVTKDGVSVAKEIELADKFENMGAQMVKEVASKTNDVAGDGTTTATVLAQAIYREGARMVAAGHNPMELKRGIDAAVGALVGESRPHLEEGQGQRRDHPGRHRLRQRQRRGRADARQAMDKVGEKASSRSRRPRGSSPSSRSSRVCSSTAATSRPTS